MLADSRTQPYVFYSDRFSYKSVSEGKLLLDGYITSGDLDLVNDVVSDSCMDDMAKQFQDRTIKLDFEHEAFRADTELGVEIAKTTLPIGKAVGVTRDSKGVRVQWELNPYYNKLDEKGNVTRSFELIKKNVENGYLDAFSIAFIPEKVRYVQKGEKKIRILDRIKLLNTALTGNPVNPEANMVNVFTKSLSSYKENGEVNMEEQKIVSKGYEKDGHHQHTSENQLGEHNHPEIEKRIDELRRDVREALKELEGRNKPSLLSDGETKSEEGDIMEEEATKTETPVEEPKVEEPKTDSESCSDESCEAPEAEQKSNVQLEIKSLMDELKTLKTDLTEMKNFMEKANHKSRVEENSTEVKSTPKISGPLQLF